MDAAHWETPMTHSEHIHDIAAALSKAQAAVRGAQRDSANPFYKSTYADLQSVWDACRDALSDNGLAVVQSAGADAQGVRVSTMLVHASGQWFADDLHLKPKDDGPQALGSCISYGRRYALAAFVGVYQTDNDAETAEGRGDHAAPAPKANVPKATATKPDGYDAWLSTMQQVATKGLAALQIEFKAASLEQRRYATTTDRVRWGVVKAAATAADAK
ncbi:hypothetical protein EBS80_03330 [bacterium]|nr:hypothetical protein [bacterium]